MQMSWEKSSPELVALFEELAPKEAGVVQKKMFGWPCCFVNGNLFAGLHKESMIFRLPPAGLAAFLQVEGAREFEPMPGRKMKGYGIWADPLKRDRKALTRWIGRSLEFARGLPVKAAKSAAAKKSPRAKKSV